MIDLGLLLPGWAIWTVPGALQASWQSGRRRMTRAALIAVRYICSSSARFPSLTRPGVRLGGVLPVNLRLTSTGTPTAERAARVLSAVWRGAGPCQHHGRQVFGTAAGKNPGHESEARRLTSAMQLRGKRLRDVSTTAGANWDQTSDHTAGLGLRHRQS